MGKVPRRTPHVHSYVVKQVIEIIEEVMEENQE